MWISFVRNKFIDSFSLEVSLRKKKKCRIKLFYGRPLLFKTSLLTHFPSKTMRKVQVVSNKNEKKWFPITLYGYSKTQRGK
jgi:hypothetical protein